MRVKTILFVALLSIGGFAFGQNYPKADISNGVIQAELMLPDPQHGSYQGTRFDWSGIIFSLQYQGHEYFGKWYEKHDPKIHDAITGPVEEFRTNDSGLGYEEAKAGGTFVRAEAGAFVPAKRSIAMRGWVRVRFDNTANPAIGGLAARRQTAHCGGNSGLSV